MRTKNLLNHGQVLNRVFTFFVILAFSPVMLKSQAPPPGCSLSCNNGVNMSVDVVMDADGNCAAELTVVTFSQGCDAAVGYAILIEHGTETIFDSRTSGPVTLGLLDPVQWLAAGEYIKKNVTYKILALDGDKAILNTCWGNMLVEDKAPPELIAGDDIPVQCCAVPSFVPPTAADCSGLDEVKVVSERSITDCEILAGRAPITPGGTDFLFAPGLAMGVPPNFVKVLVREYIATDKCGNTTPNSVTKRIFVERLNPTAIVCPAHYSNDPTTPDIPDMGVDRPTLPAIVCNAIDPDCDKDGDGFPDPNSDCIEIPYIEKSMPPNGRFDKGVDIELVAMNVEGASPDEDLFSYCKVGATLEEIPFPSAGCKKKLMRRWSINEWNDCAGEVLLRTCTQIIEVVDNDGPTVDIGPHDFDASTNGYDCEGYVKIPPVNFVDNCGDVKKVTVNIVDENGDPVHSISEFDYENGEFAPVPVGVNTVTYTAYDECHNTGTEDVVITVSDNTPPVAICDDHTVVSITYNGEAEVPASVFDDGSFDDCGIKKFLSRRMTTGCDCGDHYPKFPDMHYLGERSGHHYYISKEEFIATKSFKLSVAMGGYNAQATGAEATWIAAQVLDVKGSAVDYWINLNEGNVSTSVGEEFYVMEIEDACGFSAYTKFCCGDDVEMVVFRAVDKWGNYNDCMVEVEVQNKFPAVLECPTDVSVNCDVTVPTDANGELDLGALFGVMVDNPEDRGSFLIRMSDLAYPMTYSGLWDGYAYNNCGIVPLDEDFVDNRDQCGRGNIVRTFTVQGTTQSCSQVITFDRADDFLLTGITPPPAPPVIYDCLDLTQNTKVSLDPETYGRPTYDESSCDLVGINFEDDIFTFIDEQDDETCAKVIRTWTVIDWCAVEGATSAAEYTSQPYTQIFKIIDKDAPVITGDCSDKSVVVSSANCDKTQVTMQMTANDGVDGCTDPANLLWSVYYLENSDDPANDLYILAGSGNGNVNGAGDALASFDELLPYGTHTIKWEFSDQCGNSTACEQVVTVVNGKAPTPYCITSLSVSLTNMNVGGQDVAMAVIWASDFATGENLHPCVADEDIMYSFSEDINDTSLEVTCCSVGNPVSVRVYSSIMVDGKPVQSFCNALLMVTDPEDLCNGFNTSGCTGGVTNARVSGHVFTENNDMIEDVEIRLVGSELPPAATNDQGAYAFGGMPTGGDYVVDPKNDIDPMNGVSTLDLVIIQKHILGLDELDSPYKMIAADINMDSRVSTSDLVDLRKLILGIHEDFDENESWRFVNSDYTFANPTNPLIEYFLEQYEISGLAQDMIVDFTAVKIGDVNSSATVNNVINTENRSSKTLSLVVDKVDFTAGQPISVPVYSLDDQDLLGMQFTAGFDINLLEFVGVQSGTITLDPSNLGMQKVDQGMMTMSWHTANKLSLGQNELLFTINFMAKSSGTTDQLLSINSRLTTAEAYESTAQVMDISLNYRDGQVIDTAYKLYQNTPNPFKESTVIGFDLPATEFVTIRVHDVTGKTITQIAGEYAKGFNQVSINKSSINATGVLYYSLEAETFTATKKMVILK